MSLQEAASSGSFGPHVAQPSDAKRAESPFDPPTVDDDVDQASAESRSPFGNPYDYTTTVDDVVGDANGPDLRASRRRAWAVVGLAIVIPAAVAGLIAWQLFGGEEAPAPAVTRVTTTPAEQVTQSVQAVVAEPVQTAVAAQPEPAASSAAATTTSADAVTTTSNAAATQEGATEVAAAAATGVDPSSLTPAARLAAWTELETIQVLPGETLWLIAQNYGTTISAIVALNDIADPEMLSVGQTLMVPVGFTEEIVVDAAPAVEGGVEATEAGDASTVVSSTPVEAPTATDDLTNWHTIAPVLVEDGDSLAAIAAANNTTVEAIMALNGIANSELIYVGTELLVPVGYPDGASVTSVDAGSSVAVDTPTSTDDMMEEEPAAGGDTTDSLEE